MFFQSPPIVERLHTGFRYTEGAATDRAGNFYFTDVPANRIYRRSRDGKLTVIVRDSGGCVGLESSQTGKLAGALSRSGEVKGFAKKGRSVKVGGAPNDLVIASNGSTFVTSPDFRGKKDAILFLSTDGKIVTVDRTVREPNGIGLSPDERVLYVVGYGTHDLTAFPILGIGRLGPGKRLMKLAGPGGKPANTGGDGMAVGRDGTLYVAVPEARGIHVATPQGRFLRFIRLPEKPSNCAVGADGKELFVTAQRSVYRVRL